MSAKGFWVAQDGHVVNILPPVSISGGVSSQPFNLKNAAHVSLLLQFGALSAQPGAFVLNACTDHTGATKQAIGFNLFTQETSGAANDVLSTKQVIATTGYQPPDTANIFYVIEVDAASLPAGYPYLQLVIADGADTDFASAVAILSGLRFAEDQGMTATT